MVWGVGGARFIGGGGEEDILLREGDGIHCHLEKKRVLGICIFSL